MNIDANIINCVQTPCYVVEESKLLRNLEILSNVMAQSGCKILLAQKAFSMFSLYPLIGKYLSGTAASGLFEARLGHEHMGKETHVFSPAYREEEFGEILQYTGHIVFNSFAQWEKYRPQVQQAKKSISCGIRINPECSTQQHGIYDPCAPGSRLGVVAAQFQEGQLEGIEGLHFHTLCEQNADALEATLAAVEEKFGKYLPRMKWVNFGGGHHITRNDYDIALLSKLITRFQDKYGIQVYLEPGEAVVLNAGVLVSSVLDIMENGVHNAILDVSAACHMPDVIEMPYRPEVAGAYKAGEKQYTYRLAGPTCLAGDIIGDYSFDEPLAAGARLVFEDMALYTMVKNNTFNGMNLPSIYIARQDGRIELVRAFGYEDFKQRLS
ncbi:carboxynorspermidine decarboxylase [Clostridia bacterium OttesenSCG-928-F22]|nr:carboxynorspermidine decarboxylase [Clostridia bacterium OttesenSCG-928-F22]